MDVASDGTLMTTRARLILDTPARSNRPAMRREGHVKVDRGTLGQRSKDDDVARRASDHLERAVTHLDNAPGVGVDRDHRRFVKYDAAIRGRETRVRGADVERDV